MGGGQLSAREQMKEKRAGCVLREGMRSQHHPGPWGPLKGIYRRETALSSTETQTHKKALRVFALEVMCFLAQSLGKGEPYGRTLGGLWLA